jgi:hypothetical protein
VLPGRFSPSGLGPGGKCLEALTDLDRACRIPLLYVHILELQHEPRPVR